ncbi:MAG: lipid-A-disaccharide synthase [Sneathiella sp.]
MKKPTYKFFFAVGEPSGDALAAKLMAAIVLKQGADAVQFFGIGGPLMEAQGLKSLFPMEELTVMGITEVIPKIPQLLRRINETADAALSIKPDAFISVDAPDFSFRVAAKLKNAPFLKIHYVAPSVWAWRPGRAAKIAKLYDHLLTVLPFEPPYFEREGLPATFVGHSVIETGADAGDGQGFRSRHQIAADAPLLMILPGSRRGEVSKHLPIFKETVTLVKSSIDDLIVVIPVIGKSAEIVRENVKNWPLKVLIIEAELEKYDAMAASNVALAASGTVGLELALAKLPTVIAYKMHAFTAYIARKFVKLDYVNLINILENREIVPEHLLENCLPSRLSPSITELFKNEEKRQLQIEGCEHALQAIGVGGPAPGSRAADAVLSLLKSGK